MTEICDTSSLFIGIMPLAGIVSCLSKRLMQDVTDDVSDVSEWRRIADGHEFVPSLQPMIVLLYRYYTFACTRTALGMPTCGCSALARSE